MTESLLEQLLDGVVSELVCQELSLAFLGGLPQVRQKDPELLNAATLNEPINDVG